MNLPPPLAKKAYNEHLKQIKQAAKSNAEKIVKDTANQLKDKVAIDQPQDIKDNEEDTIIATVSVSVDGVWQKRGPLLQNRDGICHFSRHW